MLDQPAAWLATALPWLLVALFATAFVVSLLRRSHPPDEQLRAYRTDLAQCRISLREARQIAEQYRDTSEQYRAELESLRKQHPPSLAAHNPSDSEPQRTAPFSDSAILSRADGLPSSVDPQASAEPSFSPAAVQDLYTQWCRMGKQPAMPKTIFATALTFLRAQRANELAEPVFLFQDHPQIGPFVRFAPGSQSDTAVALPHPDAAFNADVHHMLFPDLSAAAFENIPALATLQPVPLRRRADNTWEKSA